MRRLGQHPQDFGEDGRLANLAPSFQGKAGIFDLASDGLQLVIPAKEHIFRHRSRSDIGRNDGQVYLAQDDVYQTALGMDSLTIKRRFLLFSS